MMSRKPLQSVNSNILRPTFPIFDEFGGQTLKVNKVSSKVKEVVSSKIISFSSNTLKRFAVAIIFQHHEACFSKKKSAFNKMVTNMLNCRNKSQQQSKTPAVTPKKRRLENTAENDISITTEIDQKPSDFSSATPGRRRLSTTAAAAAGTPQATHQRILRTPKRPTSGSSNSYETPGEGNPAEALNLSGSRVNSNKQQREPLSATRVSSLTDRLDHVEDCLRNLTTGQTTKTQQNTQPEAGSSYSSEKHSPEKNTPNNATGQAKENFKPPYFNGTGKDLQDPILAEHLALQAVIQKATRSSIQTLLRGRDSTLQASQARDLHHAHSSYEQDTRKLLASEQQRNIPTASVSAAPSHSASSAASVAMGNNISAHNLEASIVNYDHAQSAIYPLSPLGVQKHHNGDAKHEQAPPVLLPQMSILQGKIQDWRAKYTRSKTTI